MESDICLCGRTRGEHPEPTKQTDFGDAICVFFRLDRKETWKAERGVKRKHMARLLHGCTTCGQSGVQYVKTPAGGYAHAGCPGPKQAPHRTVHITQEPRGAR